MDWRNRDSASNTEEAMGYVAVYLAERLLESDGLCECEAYCARWSIPFSGPLYKKVAQAHDDAREAYGWSSSSCW